MIVVFVFAVHVRVGWGVWGGFRGAWSINIGDDLSGVLSSAPTIDTLCTHGLKLKAADGNRIAEGISPANDLENTVWWVCGKIFVYLRRNVPLASNFSEHTNHFYLLSCLLCFVYVIGLLSSLKRLKVKI